MERKITDYLLFILKKWYIVLVCTLLVGAIGFAVSYVQKDIKSREFHSIVSVETKIVSDIPDYNFIAGYTYVDLFLNNESKLQNLIESLDTESYTAISKKDLLKMIKKETVLSYSTRSNRLLGDVTIKFKPGVGKEKLSDEFVIIMLNELNAQIIEFVNGQNGDGSITYTASVDEAPTVVEGEEKSILIDILIYALAGFIISILGICLYIYCDKRIKSDDIEKLTGFKLLGIIEGSEVKDDKRNS